MYSFLFNAFPKGILNAYSCLVFINNSRGETTENQKEWIKIFKEKVTEPIKNYLIEHERISSLNDHLLIKPEKFPSLSLSLTRFSSLTEYGTGKDLSLSEVIGKKYRCSFQILVDSLFIKQDGSTSIFLKLSSAVLSSYSPCLRDRRHWQMRNVF